MGQNIAKEFLTALFDGMAYTTLFGIVASWIWVIRRLVNGQPVLPATPLVERRSTPWGAGTILLVLILFIATSLGAAEGYTLATRGHRPGRGGAAKRAVNPKETEKVGPAQAQPKGDPEDRRGPQDVPTVRGPEAAGRVAADADRSDDTARSSSELATPEMMLVQAAINSLLIVLIPLVVRATSGARLVDLGLSLAGWRRQAAVGVVSLMFLLPIIYGVQWACLKYMHVPPPNDRAHPVEKMLRDDFNPGVVYLAILTAVVLAPVCEELVFRGILQSWMVKALNDLAGRLGSDRSPLRTDPPSPSTAGPPNETWIADEVDLLLPPLQADAPKESSRLPEPTDPRRSTPFTVAAIFATSAIFAGLHGPQWPAPISLFVLAVGLGLVYQRTGSLLAPICMHAIFNSISTIALLFQTTVASPVHDKPVERPIIEKVTPLDKPRKVATDVDRLPRRDELEIPNGFF